MRRVLWLVLPLLLAGCGDDNAKRVAQGSAGEGGDDGGGGDGQGGEVAQGGETGQGGEVAQGGETSPGGQGGEVGAPETCAPLSGEGTVHGASVNEDETWTAQGSPHFLPFDTSIYATLTLEPCVVVRIAEERTVTVGVDAAIIAAGTEQQPILIEPDGAVNWASIRLIGGTARLSYTRIVGGGAPQNTVPDFRGALELNGSVQEPPGPDPVLFVDHVSIEDSASQGVYAQNGGGFDADSQALTISGSQGHALSMSPNLLETLPEGDYTGNMFDDVLLPDGLPGQISWDVTIHNRGIPYYSGGSNQFGVTSVGATTGTVVLTIEPGVVWRFKKDTGELSIDPGGTPSRGVLIAQGTEAEPIVFTSNEANPAAGDWLGIWMGGDDPRNSLDWVSIEYAGKLTGSGSNSCQSVQDGTTHNGGALRVYHAPPASLVTNSTFFESATNGIDRGWRDDLMPSFAPSSNTFTGIALCNETFPRDMNGACPGPPLPCPTTP